MTHYQPLSHPHVRRRIKLESELPEPAPELPPVRVAYSVKEIAKMLGISQPLVRRGIRSGEIPSTKIGQRVLVSKQWIENLGAQNANTP